MCKLSDKSYEAQGNNTFLKIEPFQVLPMFYWDAQKFQIMFYISYLYILFLALYILLLALYVLERHDILSIFDLP